MPEKNNNKPARRNARPPRRAAKPRPKRGRIPRAPRSNMQVMSRRNARNPKLQTHCRFSAEERVTQITVPTTVTPGTVLYIAPVNPTMSPRLAAAATQFDSWYGKFTMSVETTGNAFSQDYVILRHVPNGDPARLPTTNYKNMMLLAETCDRRDASAKLQLDSNKTASVVASWAESYNRKKPILDTDPSECNNGLFIIVADGSPGTASVNLTVRMKYDVTFFGPLSNPVVVNSTQQLTSSGGTLSSTNLFGSAPLSVGPGAVSASGNVITFPTNGKYAVTWYSTGTTLGLPVASLSSGAAFDSPFLTELTSGTVAIGNWNVSVNSAPATFTLAQSSATVTYGFLQINPNVIAY